MKKTVFILLIFVLLFCSASANGEDIYRAAESVQTEIADFSFEEFAKSLEQGEGIEVKTLGKSIADFLLSEVKTALAMVGTAVAVAVLSGIVSGLCFDKNSGSITFFICLSLIAGTTVTGFSAISKMAESAVESMAVFMSSAVPAMGALGIASGNAAAFTTVAPVMLSGTLSSYLIRYIAIPAMYMSLAMSIVSNMGEKKHLEKFSKLIMKAATWLVCGVETLYCAVVGISGFAADSVGKVAGKAAKFTVSSAIPVVGSILSDATEAVASGAAVIKNTAGAAGMMLVLLLFLAPVLKCAATLFAYKLCSAVIQPVSDKRVTDILSDTAEVLACFVGILVAVGAASVISLGILAGGVK